MTQKKDHSAAKVVTMSVRIPKREYDLLLEHQGRNPHLSLNAILVEAIALLGTKKRE